MELYHHGVKGMKWGVRRYQNEDGTLTKLGKKKHKTTALKRFKLERRDALAKAKRMGAHVRLNKKSLDESIEQDKKNGETSWATHALRDAYKATGRHYLSYKFNADLHDAYIKNFSNDTIRAGEDYVTNFKNLAINPTDSGFAKIAKIDAKVESDFRKKYSKEIKEYDY